MTKRASQRIDASVRRAGEASELFRRADSARRYAEGLLAGESTFAARQRATAAQEELQRRVVGELLRWAKGRSILKLGVLRVNRDRRGIPYPLRFLVAMSRPALATKLTSFARSFAVTRRRFALWLTSCAGLSWLA